MFDIHPEARQSRPALALGSLRSRLARQLFEWTGWSQRRTLVAAALASGDAAAAVLATSIADTIFAYGPFGAGTAMIGASYIPLYLASSLAAGVYQGGGPGPIERVRARGLAVVCSATAEIALSLIANRLAVDVLYATLRAAILLVVGYYAETFVRRALTDRGLWAAPALIVGSQMHAARICDMLVRHPGLGLRIVGVLPDKLTPGDHIGAATLPPGVSPGVEASDLAPGECEALVLSLPCDRSFARTLEIELKAPIRVVACGETATPHDLILAQPPKDWFRGSHRYADPASPMRSLMKRAFDLAVAVPAAFLTLPLLALVIAAVKWVDPGPAVLILADVRS